MKMNKAKYEEPQIKICDSVESIITTSLDPDGSSNNDKVHW